MEQKEKWEAAGGLAIIGGLAIWTGWAIKAIKNGGPTDSFWENLKDFNKYLIDSGGYARILAS